MPSSKDVQHIAINCPACNTRLGVTCRGKNPLIRCPKCESKFQIHQSDSTSQNQAACRDNTSIPPEAYQEDQQDIGQASFSTWIKEEMNWAETRKTAVTQATTRPVMYNTLPSLDSSSDDEPLFDDASDSDTVMDAIVTIIGGFLIGAIWTVFLGMFCFIPMLHASRMAYENDDDIRAFSLMLFGVGGTFIALPYFPFGIPLYVFFWTNGF